MARSPRVRASERLVALLMPGMIRTQSQQHIQDFKAFQGQDVRDAKG